MRDVDPKHIALQWSADRAEQNRLALHRTIVKRKKRARRAMVAVPAGAALAVAAALLWPPQQPTMSPSPEPDSERADRSDTLRLQDGSWARMTTFDAQARVVIDEHAQSQVRLDGGEIEVDVVPNPQREFEVLAGDVRVKVLGTRFFVETVDTQVRVRVVHGHVRVSWSGGRAELLDGESGLFPPNESRSNESTALDSEELADEPQAEAAARSTPAGRWRTQAAESDFSGAYRELREDGFDTVRNTPEDLMLAADVARLSGHPSEASAPLRRLIARHASDARAPLAAFTLGRVLLEDLHRPAQAAAAFQRAQELAPGGPLFADAMMRQAEALAASGDAEGARATAQQYLDRFPAGRHATRARSIVER